MDTIPPIAIFTKVVLMASSLIKKGVFRLEREKSQKSLKKIIFTIPSCVVVNLFLPSKITSCLNNPYDF